MLPIIVLLLSLAVSAYAQVRPSRTWHTDVARARSIQGTMPSLIGGAEIQRSSGSLGGEQAWQFRTHVQAETYRFTDSSSSIQLTTSIEAHQELTANPLNDISFNPRAMRWEEFFWFHVGMPSVSLRAGFVHRCKHDIDNLGGADEGNPTSPLFAEQRTIILTGPTLAASLAPVVSSFGTLTLAGGAEYFLNSSDNRRPASSSASWSAMQGTAWIRAHNTYGISQGAELIATAYAAVPWFSSRTGPSSMLPYDARVELGIAAKGASARAELVLVAEHLFDEIAFTIPQPTSFVGVCLRFR